MRRAARLMVTLLALLVPTMAGASPLRIAIAGSSAVYLPFRLAAERTLGEESLTAEVVTLPSNAVAQAVVTGSAAVGVSSLATLIHAIEAGQPVVGFYAGFAHADIEWFARPDIRRWADLRGKRVGVAALGGLTEGLTGLALRRHGLEPGRDVHVVVGGGERLPLLRSGRVDATILQAPAKWEAEVRGFSRLGTQKTEVGPEWPRVILWTQARILHERPDLLRAILRSHVRAIRLMRSDREHAVGTIERTLRYRREHAERAYDEVVADLDERGGLPERGLDLFWQAAVATGEVTARWPESRFFDRRFVDTFADWAPR